jgi:hypothetical protein
MKPASAQSPHKTVNLIVASSPLIISASALAQTNAEHAGKCIANKLTALIAVEDLWCGHFQGLT